MKPRPLPHNITLIVPASASSSTAPAHVREGLDLLARALQKTPSAAASPSEGDRQPAPWPFNPQPIFYNGTGSVVAAGRLWQLDWRPRDAALAARFPHTRVRALSLSPPFLLLQHWLK
jgi:hypothetical protein